MRREMRRDEKSFEEEIAEYNNEMIDYDVDSI